MTTSLLKGARILAVVALACVSTHSESRGGGGLPGLPTKGTCGFILTMSYPFVYLYDNPGAGWGLDGLGTINFQTSTISINITLQDHPQGQSFTESPLAFTAPFTILAGPIPNSSTITFNLPDNSVFTFNLIAVNGGKTILMQGFSPSAGSQDGSITGTCQM